MARSSRRERASLVIDEILETPEALEDLDDLLEGIDLISLREEAVERFSEAGFGVEMAILTDLLGKIGLGKTKGDLARIVTDESCSYRQRSAASSLLLAQEPVLAERVFAKLRPEEKAMLEQASLRGLLALVIENPSAIAAVTSLLEGEEGEVAAPLEALERLEEVRRGIGLYPLQVYEDVLFEESLEALIEPVVELIIQERDPRGVELLRFVERNAESDRAAYWKSLADRAEKEIGDQPPVDLLEGEAWIGYPTPPFPPPVMVLLDNPDGTRTFGLLELGESPTDQRAGTVIHDPAQHLVDEIPGPPASVSVPLGVARALFDSYYEDVDEVEAEEIPISFVELMQHLPVTELPRSRGRLEPGEAEVQQLLDEHPYSKWALDLRGLIEEMDEPESLEDLPVEWLDRSIEIIDDSEVVYEISDAFRIMSVLDSVEGQEDRAALAAALSEGVLENGLSYLGVGRILLRRTFEAIRQSIGELADEAADPWAIEPHEEKEMLRLFVPVAKKQLKDRAVPFVRETHGRLQSEGMSSREALRAIALAVAAEAKRMTITDDEYDEELYIARLDALTGPREQE